MEGAGARLARRRGVAMLCGARNVAVIVDHAASVARPAAVRTGRTSRSSPIGSAIDRGRRADDAPTWRPATISAKQEWRAAGRARRSRVRCQRAVVTSALISLGGASDPHATSAMTTWWCGGRRHGGRSRPLCTRRTAGSSRLVPCPFLPETHLPRGRWRNDMEMDERRRGIRPPMDSRRGMTPVTSGSIRPSSAGWTSRRRSPISAVSCENTRRRRLEHHGERPEGQHRLELARAVAPT